MNAEMSREFSRFYEVVLTNGLLDASPHVLSRLKTVTDSFLRFSSSIPEASGYLSPEDDRTSLTKSIHPKKESNSPSSSNQSPPTRAVVQPDMAIPGVTELPASNYAASMHSGQSVASGSYEVVAQATPQNASFPQFANMDPQANPAAMMQLMQGSFPYSNLAPPATYAFQELSFAKRLSRRTSERAWALAAMPNPPPERFAAVFGFTLLFETREQIAERLLAKLHDQQALYKQPWKPDHVGPVATEMEQHIRNLFVNFHETFLNAEEVDEYLKQLGISIPQHAEYVEAAVDMGDLKDNIDPATAPNGKFPSPDQSFNDATSNGSHSKEMMANNQMAAVGHTNAMQGAINQSVASLMFPQDVGAMWAAPAWTKPKFTIDVGVLVEGKFELVHCVMRHSANLKQKLSLDPCALAKTLVPDSRTSTAQFASRQAWPLRNRLSADQPLLVILLYYFLFGYSRCDSAHWRTLETYTSHLL